MSVHDTCLVRLDALGSGLTNYVITLALCITELPTSARLTPSTFSVVCAYSNMNAFYYIGQCQCSL